MIRIYRMRTYRDLQPPEFLEAFTAGRQAADAVSKISGVKSCNVYLSGSDLVFIAEGENYGIADKTHQDQRSQAFTGSLVEFGYRPYTEEFLQDIDRLVPHVEQGHKLIAEKKRERLKAQQEQSTPSKGGKSAK